MNVGHASEVDSRSTAIRYHLGRSVFSGVNLTKNNLSFESKMEEYMEEGAGGVGFKVGGGGGSVSFVAAGVWGLNALLSIEGSGLFVEGSITFGVGLK